MSSAIRVPSKALVLLAVLAARGARAQTRDALAATLWPDHDLSEGRANLRRHLHLLAKALHDDIVIASRQTVQLNPAMPIEIDLVEFDRLLSSDFAAAIDFYGGPLCDGITDETLEPLRGEYERMYEQLLRDAIIGARDNDVALERYLSRALANNPLDEETVRELMLVRQRSGNRSGALRAYNELRSSLQRELNVAPSTATVAVFESIAFNPGKAAPTNIVAPTTSIIGRERDIDTVARLFESHRVVSLVGTAGIGKSRLATAFALSRMLEYPDGIWRIDLASTTTQREIRERFAATISAPATTAGIMDGIYSALRGKRVLCVLDSCEHVADDVATVASELHDHTECSVLITSRRRVGAHVEAVHSVEPLSPAAAIRLFVERATASAPTLPSGKTQESLFGEIVSLVDRIPLAIELTAALAKMLSPAQMRDRLRSPLRLLPSMERALSWSYDLLDAKAQVLFARVAVFEEHWTLEAAEAICSDDMLPSGDVLPALETLIDLSLVKVELHPEGSFYSMLAPVREFSRALLSAEEHERLSIAHARYYRDLTQRFLDPMDQDGDDFLRAMASAGPNLLQALHVLAQQDEPRDAAMLLSGASPFWGRRFQAQLIVELAHRYVEPETLARFEPRLRADVLRGAGRLAFGRAEWSLAETLDLAAADEYVACGLEYDSLASRLGAAIAAGYYRLSLDERISAHALIEADLRAATGIPPWTLAGVHANLSVMHLQRRDIDRTLEFGLSALASFRQHSRKDETGKILTVLARAYIVLGRGREAEACARESVEIFRALGEQATLAEALRNLARAQLAADRPEADVYASLREAVSLMQASPEARFVVYTVVASFEAFAHFGRYRDAAKAAGLALAFKERMRYLRRDEELLEAPILRRVREALGEEYEHLEQLGRSCSLATLYDDLANSPSKSTGVHVAD